MDKEKIQRTKQSFSFIISAIYKWSADTVNNSGGRLKQPDFYLIGENALEALKENLTKESLVLFEIAQKEYEEKLSNNIFEQAKKEIGW